MLHSGGGLRFLNEPSSPIHVARQVLGQHLERNIAIESRVSRPVDNAHAAAADFFADAVVADAAAGEIHVGMAGVAVGRRILAQQCFEEHQSKSRWSVASTSLGLNPNGPGALL
jgi:hypothetical protein